MTDVGASVCVPRLRRGTSQRLPTRHRLERGRFPPKKKCYIEPFFFLNLENGRPTGKKMVRKPDNSHLTRQKPAPGAASSRSSRRSPCRWPCSGEGSPFYSTVQTEASEPARRTLVLWLILAPTMQRHHATGAEPHTVHAGHMDVRSLQPVRRPFGPARGAAHPTQQSFHGDRRQPAQPTGPSTTGGRDASTARSHGSNRRSNVSRSYRSGATVVDERGHIHRASASSTTRVVVVTSASVQPARGGASPSGG